MSFAKVPYRHKRSYPGDPKDKWRMTPFHMPDLYNKAFKMEKRSRRK